MELGNVDLGRFKVVKAKSDAQQKSWERADIAIEICKWLHLPDVMRMISHLEPHEAWNLMERAKKEGEKPKAYFKHLVNEKRNPTT